MRNLTTWNKDICKALGETDELKEYVEIDSPDLNYRERKREINRVAKLITEVELAIILLKAIAPTEPVSSVVALLSGYRFPHPALESEGNWQLVRIARFYLTHHKSSQWSRSIQTYLKLPDTIRIFSFTHEDEVPSQVPASIYPHRARLYYQTLSHTPSHQTIQVNLATAGNWYAEISEQGHSPHQVPIYIPSVVANLAANAPVINFTPRSSENPSVTVTLAQLLDSAQEMDERLSGSNMRENYCQRLSGIELQLHDDLDNDFHRGDELKIDRLLHIVGLLNVGKSTLIEILIYHLAKSGYRCALIVNDVVAAVRIASLFAHRLGIPAAPILGADRESQLAKVYEPLLATEGEDITAGGTHPAWRWFSPICPLLTLVKSAQTWKFGAEPCHQLQPSAVEERQIDDEDEEEAGNGRKKFTCPLYYQCPRHQLERDIAIAKVWILTPSSFIHTHIPSQLGTQKITFAEAVYRECHVLFVDEADRVQVQLDEAFSPGQTLVDASGNSFLNKLGLKLSETIYSSDRRSMGAERFAAFKRAQDYAQIATDLIMPRLHDRPELVAWLGNKPFTGRSLFSYLIFDLLSQLTGDEDLPDRSKLAPTKGRGKKQIPIATTEMSDADKIRIRKELIYSLEDFFQHPLRHKGGALSDLAWTLLTAETQTAAVAEGRAWLQGWLKSVGIAIPEPELVEAIRQLHFAVLITVLGNQLGILIDRIGDITRSQRIDLHDLSQILVYRPPKDYLAVIPAAPVGNILGFKYSQSRDRSRGGKLEYFRYVGVGRDLLLSFPSLWAVDGRTGPHTVLISGTSYAPGAPAYHIRPTPTVLLAPSGLSSDPDRGIAQSQFYFSPQLKSVDGKAIAVSGLPAHRRQIANADMVKSICQPPNQSPSFLERVFQQLEELAQMHPEQWGDRGRILLVTNSYDEAEQIEPMLRQHYRVESIDKIAVLRRDRSPTHLPGIRRGQIRDLKDLDTQIVIAPLMALERGHNILNENMQAAFGAALFICRPMPVPDDWQTTVQQLNHWALAKYVETIDDNANLTEIHHQFYLAAQAKMRELNCQGTSFKQLNPTERSVLCWTQLVSIWQIIGRLVRGNVPCIVHFLDSKFAPLSTNGELDNETTSLLVAILKELSNFQNHPNLSPAERTLMAALYGDFIRALTSTQGLNHHV
jgi:pPIWI RE three-gene island domain Z